jgi:uncharacterized protein YbcI
MSGTQEPSSGNVLQAVSNAMVRLHKEQLGRGPTNARTYFAGPDTLVCTLEDSLLPAERMMVEMGEEHRVRESRLFLQVASQDQFIETVEKLLSRKVRAFSSAVDPPAGVVFEVFSFEPEDTHGDGATPT